MKAGERHHPETIVKISKALKGGVKITAKTRAKMVITRRQNVLDSHKEELKSELRICPQCEGEKNLTDFSLNGKFTDGSPRYGYCKACRTNLDREKRLQKFFLMTVEDADKVFAYQGNLCAICKRPALGKRLALDHRHSDGLVRGGLCNWCNRAIARFHDDIIRLRAAADYLENPPAVRALGREHFARPGRVGTKKQRAIIRRENKARKNPR